MSDAKEAVFSFLPAQDRTKAVTQRHADWFRLLLASVALTRFVSAIAFPPSQLHRAGMH